MDQALANLKQQLKALGVEADVEPEHAAAEAVRSGEAVLKRGRSKQRYALTYGDRVPLVATAHRRAGRPHLVFASRIAPKTADAFRRADVQFVDGAGNAWIQFGDVLIDVRGRTAPQATATPASGNLFAAGRAQVVFALLAWPHLWDAPQRDVAHAAGVSLGQANSTLKLLRESGYAHGVQHKERAALLDLWAAAFPTGLARRLTLATFHGKPGHVKSAHGEPVYVSGETAAKSLLRPTTTTVYVDDLDPRLPVVNRGRADGEPTIVVRRAFWRAPETPTDKPGLAPWPLVYADLLASEDPRVRGVAADVRAQHACAQQGRN